MNTNLKKSFIYLVIASLFFFFGQENLHASSIIFTNTLPATDIIASSTVASSTNNIQFRNNGSGSGNRWVGFTFTTASATTLDKVTLFIYNNLVGTDVLGASLTLNLYSVASSTTAPAGSTPIFTDSSLVFPATYNNESYITLDLSTPYAISAGTYAVVVSFNSSSSTRTLNLNEAPSGSNLSFYSIDNGASYTSITQLNFVVQTVAIPEPKVSLLIGLGFTTLIATQVLSASTRTTLRSFRTSRLFSRT